MKTHSIRFLSGFIAAIAVPVLVDAASLSRSLLWNPTEIAKDKGIVVLAEETAKSAPKAKMNVDSNGVILKRYDPVSSSLSETCGIVTCRFSLHLGNVPRAS